MLIMYKCEEVGRWGELYADAGLAGARAMSRDAPPICNSRRGYFLGMLLRCRTSTSVIDPHPLLHLDVYPYLASFLRPASLSGATPSVLAPNCGYQY